jgi:hypothetical protein
MKLPEDFTFLGNDNKPYRLMIIGNSDAWIHYLHPDNKWVTLEQIDIDRVFMVNNNLSQKEQDFYPPTPK